MRTAIDTNVVSAIWSNEPLANAYVVQLLRMRDEGSLIISPIVLVELTAHPRATEAFVQEFLTAVGISVEYNLQQGVWTEAARRFAKYAVRRRRAGHGESKRLPADFVVGAHALLQTDRLITRDLDRYRQDFPELILV